MLADPAVLYAESAQKRCREICDEIVQEIRILAPTRQADTQPHAVPGTLRDSYRAVDAPPGAKIVTNVGYWFYVEKGTRKMAAQPHVAPAVEIVRARHT